MAFEGLAEKLSNSFKKLRSKGKLSEADVKEAMREVRLALLEADVNYKVAKEFTGKVTERAIGAEVMESLTPAQMVIKIVNEELAGLMGGAEARLKMPAHPPAVIMMCGLQGAGKTTHAAKLAHMLKTQGHRPLLVAGDIYRPAAIKQLQVVAEKAGAPVYEKGAQDPVVTAKEAVKHAKDYGNDYVIIDTAGRLQIDEELMEELRRIKEAVEPTDILLVVDSMTGQEAVNVAKSFDDLLDISGVILTKLDGDTRGGAALSVKAVTGKPIKFAGTGEKLGDLEVFHPDRMAGRILGMGDVLSLIEDAQMKLDEKAAAKTAERLMHNKLDLNDMLEQFEQVRKMGPIKGILSKLPGMGSKVDDLDIDERVMDRTAAIILSMTPYERSHPESLNASRKRRIAAGCGQKVEDVNRLLNQFKQTQKLMKQFGGKKGRRMLRGMGGGMPF
ncbi:MULTISPECIES: signal recognition particle protein [Eubacteriales]|jgi:signal recognition particle subunit SRP54|uniref:signal recognition particle protein n=1 Tax=Eubacteriales TaxID=186802 RepID=UPI001368EA48|nr:MULTISPECIES: signal recognition particle protein [unclassified Neglectibacter]MCI9115755.1 signal recognition particle protein [Acutalibacter sp.]NBI16076.1 signal recognition particle protein [Neglectibacter sp. 59]NBJ71773.1 signal recognition particle protein [Neglectibacter sp. X4]NCE79550.1 signal recognition particle protein [Neglectibacter sp. X58]